MKPAVQRLLGSMREALEGLALLLLGALVVVGTLYAGSLLNGTKAGLLGLSKEYVGDLSPEIGGLGLGIIVGGVTGWVAAGAERRSAHRAARRRLRLRGRDLAITLANAISSGAVGLPLHGFTFKDETIDDATLRRPAFAQGASASTLQSIHFVGCELRGARFADARGCLLLDVWFESCRLVRCDFSGATLAREGETAVFLGSEVIGCRFDGATFIEISLKDSTLRRCTFWGATLISSHLPETLFKSLEDSGLLKPAEGNQRRVLTRLELLKQPTLRRVLALLRFELGFTSFSEASSTS